MTRQDISGLKYRQGLSLFRLGQYSITDATRLCQELAEQRINLVSAGISQDWDGKGETWICLQEEHLDWAWRVARELGTGDSGGSSNPEIISPVSLLTIYPRGPGLSLCGRVMEGLARAELPLLALEASLAALVVVLPQDDLAKALGALLEMMALPAPKV